VDLTSAANLSWYPREYHGFILPHNVSLSSPSFRDRDVVPALKEQSITVAGGVYNARLVVHMQTSRAAVERLLMIVANCIEKAKKI
jgi:hypothetical protein